MMVVVIVRTVRIVRTVVVVVVRVVVVVVWGKFEVRIIRSVSAHRKREELYVPKYPRGDMVRHDCDVDTCTLTEDEPGERGGRFPARLVGECVP